MTTYNSNDYYGSFTDDDSGIGLDLDRSSSTDSTMIKPSPLQFTQPKISTPTATVQKRFDSVPFVKFTSDGIIERIRPATMKNSENGDYVLCRTDRGSYVAYRTPVVPQWITRLVQEIESREQE